MFHGSLQMSGDLGPVLGSAARGSSNMSDKVPSLKEQIQEALERPIPTAVYDPASVLLVNVQEALERLGLRIDDPYSDALSRPIRIDFTYSREMKGLPTGSTGKILQSLPCYVDDAELARGAPTLVRLFEDALKVHDLSLRDVTVTDVQLTRFVRVDAGEQQHEVAGAAWDEA